MNRLPIKKTPPQKPTTPPSIARISVLSRIVPVLKLSKSPAIPSPALNSVDRMSFWVDSVTSLGEEEDIEVRGIELESDVCRPSTRPEI